MHEAAKNSNFIISRSLFQSPHRGMTRPASTISLDALKGAQTFPFNSENSSIKKEKKVFEEKSVSGECHSTPHDG